MADDIKLHIPAGINFDCTGCGNCCFSWPVPLTDGDVAKISTLPLKEIQDGTLQLQSIGNTGTLQENIFTKALGKRPDGKCQFLLLDNQCKLHRDYGIEAKPAMCRLFPYTFTETPAGVYAAASFASTGVLFNAGRPLSEQREHLGQQYKLFKSLFPDLMPDWKSIQLIDGQPLSYDTYEMMEREILSALEPSVDIPRRVEKSLVSISQNVSAQALVQRDFDQIAGIEAKPKVVDQLLLKGLCDAYFPPDVYQDNVCTFDSAALARALVMPPNKVLLSLGSKQISFGEVVGYTLGPLSSESEALLLRFAYLKVFSKLYFGPGFAGLSLVSGLNHLSTIIALVRIILKAENLEKKPRGETISFDVVAEIVRKLERRLTVANFSNEAKMVLEVLFASSKRVERIFSLSA